MLNSKELYKNTIKIVQNGVHGNIIFSSMIYEDMYGI